MGGHRPAKPLVDERKHLPLEGLRPQKTVPDQNGDAAPLKARIGHEVVEDSPLDDVPVAAESPGAFTGLANAPDDFSQGRDTAARAASPHSGFRGLPAAPVPLA